MALRSALSMHLDTYDEVPYCSLPIAWTAPERLALASLLHGGPRVTRADYAYLELGCGNGANLLPLAAYRPTARFVGLDRAPGVIATANARKAELGLDNVTFLQCDLNEASRLLRDSYDFIVAHGVFSWIPDGARDALLALCTERLAGDGLVYLSYNCRPGWDVRGLVREFLVRQCTREPGLRARHERARSLCSQMLEQLGPSGDPFAQLLAREFRFVLDAEPAYVIHEFLSEHNRPYWRSEFLELVGRSGLSYVADADFDHPARRGARRPEALESLGLSPDHVADVLDLLSYRLLHAPILGRSAHAARPMDLPELAGLHLAARLSRRDGPRGTLYRHPSGYDASVQSASLARALDQLLPRWPSGLPIGSLFPDGDAPLDDLMLLHQHGLVELRALGHDGIGTRSTVREAERRWYDYYTTPYHDIESA